LGIHLIIIIIINLVVALENERLEEKRGSISRAAMSDSVIVDENMDNQIVAKLVLLGESDVGKSSLVYRFVKEKYMDKRESTIGG